MKILCVLLAMILWGLNAGMAQAMDPASLPSVLSSPQDYQVFQRDSRIEGHVLVAGSVPAAAFLEKIQVRIIGKSITGDLSGKWQSLKFDSDSGSFHEIIAVPAGGWYCVAVRFFRLGRWAATNYVEHVGVGEVFVIAGQSNSANYGEEKQHTLTGMVSAFSGTNWQLAADPQPGAGGKKGSFLPVFGDAMANQFHVPVGLVPMGIGSTSVREWLPVGVVFTNPPTLTRNVVEVHPSQWEANGTIFNNFSERMKQFGPHGFRAVLWHQGESDGHQAKPECSLSGALYHDYLRQVIQDSRRDIGWPASWFVALVSYHNPGDPSSPELRAAQKALWDEGVALAGPDSDTLTGSMREKNGLGIHLSAEGLRRHGHMWAEKVAPWLEQQINPSK